MTAILLALTLLTAPVSIEVHYLPDGTRVTLPSGETVQAFNLGEYKQLLQIDADLWASTQKISVLEKMNAGYIMALGESSSISEYLWEDLEILRARNTRLEEKWAQCQDSSESESLWPYIMGGVGVVVGVLGLGFGVGSAL